MEILVSILIIILGISFAFNVKLHREVNKLKSKLELELLKTSAQKVSAKELPKKKVGRPRKVKEVTV